MRENGLVPNAVVYNSAISACRAGGQWRAAQDLIYRMIDGGIEPTAYHFGCVIDACSRGGAYGKVMLFMRKMEERGLQPDVKTFTTALTACARDTELSPTTMSACAPLRPTMK